MFQGLYESVSLCFHPFGVVLAAGSTEGHLVVLNAENGAPVVTIRVCGSPLNCLGYNPGTLFFSSYYHTTFFYITLYSDIWDKSECMFSFLTSEFLSMLVFWLVMHILCHPWPPISSHCDTFQKTIIDIFTAVRTSNLI